MKIALARSGSPWTRCLERLRLFTLVVRSNWIAPSENDIFPSLLFLFLSFSSGLLRNIPRNVQKKKKIMRYCYSVTANLYAYVSSVSKCECRCGWLCIFYTIRTTKKVKLANSKRVSIKSEIQFRRCIKSKSSSLKTNIPLAKLINSNRYDKSFVTQTIAVLLLRTTFSLSLSLSRATNVK